MSKKSQPCSVPHFAAALQRLLRQPANPLRPSCESHWQAGDQRFHGSSYADTVPRLLWNLDSDDSYREVVDRPHCNVSLRAALKKHAHELHESFGVIVTLNGNHVSLRLAKGN